MTDREELARSLSLWVLGCEYGTLDADRAATLLGAADKVMAATRPDLIPRLVIALTWALGSIEDTAAAAGIVPHLAGSASSFAKDVVGEARAAVVATGRTFSVKYGSVPLYTSDAVAAEARPKRTA